MKYCLKKVLERENEEEEEGEGKGGREAQRREVVVSAIGRLR